MYDIICIIKKCVFSCIQGAEGGYLMKILTINGRGIYTAPCVCNDFDAGKSITRAIVRALNIETFLGPEIASTRQASAISGPKNVKPSILSLSIQGQ